MPGTGSDRPLARPIGQPRVPVRLPARPELGDQLSQHFPGQPGHPAIGDSGGTGQRPGHTTTLLRLTQTSRPANHDEVVSVRRRGERVFVVYASFASGAEPQVIGVASSGMRAAELAERYAEEDRCAWRRPD